MLTLPLRIPSRVTVFLTCSVGGSLGGGTTVAGGVVAGGVVTAGGVVAGGAGSGGGGVCATAGATFVFTSSRIGGPGNSIGGNAGGLDLASAGGATASFSIRCAATNP